MVICWTFFSFQINVFERPLEQFGQNYSAILINPIKSYNLDRLPSKYLRRYQFACKVVDLIKRKTPKVCHGICVYLLKIICIMMK